MHVQPAHVFAALDAAASGPVAEGCVGGGTGMICHEFKGGIGTASRVVAEQDGGWTVGALVQANYGARALLRVDGAPVGREIPTSDVPAPGVPGAEDAGSIIIVLATDAPLLASQCRRLAQRATIGLARMGGNGSNSSGDIFVAFATGNTGLYQKERARAPITVRMLPNDGLTPLFEAAADATEEAILNALCMATTTVGIDGRVAHALPLERLKDVLRYYRRIEE
jgi:D-aminopeptidase